MIFINNLGYFEGGVPPMEPGRKQLKHIIDIRLLIEARIREQRKIIFGKF